MPPEAFIRRVRATGAEDAVSVSRRKYVTARECRLKLKRMHGSASLHVGKVRDLPFGFNVSPDPERDAQGKIIEPGHCLLVNLPNPVTECEAAEFAASQLIKIARYITPDQERAGDCKSDSLSLGWVPHPAVILCIAKRSRRPARRGGDLILETLSQGWDTTTLNQRAFLFPIPYS